MVLDNPWMSRLEVVHIKPNFLGEESQEER